MGLIKRMNSYWCPFDALLEDRRMRRRCRCGFFPFCNIFIVYLQRLSADSRSKLPRYRILNSYDNLDDDEHPIVAFSTLWNITTI